MTCPETFHRHLAHAAFDEDHIHWSVRPHDMRKGNDHAPHPPHCIVQ